MPATSAGLADYVGTIRRRLVYIASIAPPILFLFIFLAFWIKPQYQATATILRQLSSMTKDVIVSTVASGSEEQIEVIQGRVMVLEHPRAAGAGFRPVSR